MRSFTLDNLADLTEVFREELDDPHLVIDHSTSQETLERWDSLAHVRIVAAVEERFEFNFTLSQIESVTSVGQILNIIATHHPE